MAQTYRRARIEKIVNLIQSMRDSEERKIERMGEDLDPYVKGLFDGAINSFDAVIDILTREFLEDDVPEQKQKG